MSGLSHGGAAVGLDHVGIVGADLDVLARSFMALGFHLTPFAAHASGRTGNRCAMLRDGGYLELMATLPGQSSATLDRFLAIGPGAHVLALEVVDEAAALDRLRAAGVAAGEVSITERASETDGAKARFALIMPPDLPEGRVLLIRHLTHDLLWRPEFETHANRAVGLTEAVYASDVPAETMTRISRLAGRPAEPDPLGGYRVRLARGMVRVLSLRAATNLFAWETGVPNVRGVADATTSPRAAATPRNSGTPSAPMLVGLTIATETADDRVVRAGGVAIRLMGRPAGR